VFFSEPYEAAGGRGDEVYRELLLPLEAIAASSGKKLVVKLHPFESASERAVLVKSLLPSHHNRIEIVSGPLTNQLLREAWFGLTVESTTVIECAMHGVPCFIAEWIGGSRYGYVQQYSAFGLGQLLSSAELLPEIPRLLAEVNSHATHAGALWRAIDPEQLRRLLTGQYQRDPAAVAQAQPTHD
jgi:hypothetical protein